jgi:AcrR family transcriptional regulator
VRGVSVATEKTAKKRAEKVEHILAVATEVFSEKGFHGALTDEIAERAGVSKLSLYYYIGDKATLYDAVWMRLESQFSPLLYFEFDKNESAEKKLTRMIHGMAEVSKMIPVHSIALRELFAGGKNLPTNMQKDTDYFFEKFSLLCEELKEEGWDVDVPPIVVAWMLYSFFIFWQVTMACQKDYDGTQREVINDIGPEASDKLIRIVMLLARRMLKAPEGE